jgi:hypothetical protein
MIAPAMSRLSQQLFRFVFAFVAICFCATGQAAPKLPFGLYGNYMIDVRASCGVYSCSGDIVWPDATNSTGQATLASDGTVTTHNGTLIDGTLFLGATAEGAIAIWSNPSTGTVVTGIAGREVGHIAYDPLGSISGALAQVFADVTTNNNNAYAIPPILGNHINLGNGATMTLTSGRYFLSSLNIRNSSTLKLAATNGPIEIYLTGGGNFGNGTIVQTGSTTNFQFYSNYVNPTNGASDILINNNGSFRGFLYAPYANVQINNSGDFYGAVWGGVVQFNEMGDIFMNTDFVDMTRPETRDIEGDGMDDAWELSYWNSTTTQTANADADADGFSNREEFGWDTDPKLLSSIPPRLQWNSANQLELPWSSTGRIFAVWASSNLCEASGWSFVTNGVAGTGGNLVFPVNTVATCRVFRAGASPP